MVEQKRLTDWVGDQYETGGQYLFNSSEVHQVVAAARDNQTAEDSLLKQILHEPNLYQAWKQVKRNHGAPGVDKITLGEFEKNLIGNIEDIITSVNDGIYKPCPVRRKDIEKPGGGYRTLGIPIIRDRVLGQAIQQVLTLIF